MNSVKNVQPIKDSQILKDVQTCLLAGKHVGRRNYTIFQVGKATLLRVSDVLRLKMNDVFEADGRVKQRTVIRDKKTNKINRLYLFPVKKDLQQYWKWRQENLIASTWLFPSFRQPENHIKEKGFYKAMIRVGNLLNINYLGTHTMRKTGAYRVYIQSGNNIGLVMRLLNHSSEATTLAYLGLDQLTQEQILDKINFG